MGRRYLEGQERYFASEHLAILLVLVESEAVEVSVGLAEQAPEGELEASPRQEDHIEL